MSFESELLRLKGIRITTSALLPSYRDVRTQVRFPRSKKKRIRKKWAQNPRNFRTHQESCVNDVYKVGDEFLIHPQGLENLKLYLAKAAEKKIAAFL